MESISQTKKSKNDRNKQSTTSNVSDTQHQRQTQEESENDQKHKEMQSEKSENTKQTKTSSLNQNKTKIGHESQKSSSILNYIYNGTRPCPIYDDTRDHDPIFEQLRNHSLTASANTNNGNLLMDTTPTENQQHTEEPLSRQRKVEPKNEERHVKNTKSAEKQTSAPSKRKKSKRKPPPLNIDE